MEIRTQHTTTLKLADVSELIGAQIIKAIGDDTLSPEQVEITFDAKSKTFKVSIDVTWEASTSDDSEPDGYEYAIHLENDSRVGHDDWGESLDAMVDGEHDGDSVLLVMRDGTKIVAVIADVEYDGDLWVTIDGGDAKRVTNFPKPDDGEITRVKEVHYNV